MNRDELIELACRVEKASEADQAIVLDEVWNALGPMMRWTGDQARQFANMMDALAYESAAVMFVPKGWYWRFGSGVLWVGWAHLNLKHPDHCDYGDEHSSHAATPALALTAASLRAIAERVND